MPLRSHILASLPAERLRHLVDAHDAHAVDRRRRDALAAALASPGITEEMLLRALSEAEVKAVCARAGISDIGRKRALTERLLAAYARPPAPPHPAAPARPNAPTLDRPVPPRAPAPAARRRTFVAIDFETADNGRDSACAVAMVRVEAGEIVARRAHLIRPPRRTFLFTGIHGISWAQVARERTFGELWPELEPLLVGADFLAAHNAPFDRSVLQACARAHGLAAPPHPFLDTVKVAREAWSVYPTKLPDVCRHLRIPLRHHDAASDAEACARIVVAAGADRAIT